MADDERRPQLRSPEQVEQLRARLVAASGQADDLIERHELAAALRTTNWVLGIPVEDDA